VDARRPPPATAPAVVLVLDAVQDPGNFGTLVRSAEALGAAGVISAARNGRSLECEGGALRGGLLLPPAAGAAPWAEALGLAAGGGLRRSSRPRVGGEPLRARRGAALVVGNEGGGISPEVLATADRRVGIPLRGRAESLNVAAAAAILLYELTR
jgi:RNA methyltransferase, TrmH family